MGKVVSVLSNKNAFDIYLDLENASPNSPSETTVYNTVASTLEKGPSILSAFEEYKGCGDEIKAAISKPSASNEDAAWKAVTIVVGHLKSYFLFSQELQSSVEALISSLIKVNPLQSLADQQALAKLLADTIDFVLRFDELKMKRHQLQNDFSYYRRIVSRKSGAGEEEEEIDEETCNRMSLFFASANPMLQAVAERCRTMSGGSTAEETKEKISNLFSTMSNVCLSMVNSEKITSKDTKLFCLRCMTGSIIIFDHVNPAGSFGKKTPIKIKSCVNTLKNFDPPSSTDDTTSTTALVNAMKFSTITLNKPGTPNSVKQLLV